MHTIKIWVDFTGYHSNHFSGCRLKRWLFWNSCLLYTNQKQYWEFTSEKCSTAKHKKPVCRVTTYILFQYITANAHSNFVHHQAIIFVCQKERGNLVATKGQKNSKWFFQADISSKTRMNKFDLTTCRLVFIRFLEESD